MTIKPLLLSLITLFLIGCSPNSPTKKAFRHQTSTPTKTEAILKLDTKGHTAKIGDIIVTKSGDIISASEDKTIRVWDSKTGKEKRKILGQIGAGSGEIFAIALSPNNNFLAIGGFLAEGHGVNDDLVGTIRIYNYQSGKLLKILKSHTNVVADLAFSSDGKYLISGSADKTAKIWRVEDFTLQETIKFHTKDVYAVKIIEKGGNYFAVTAGNDNKIALYNMETKKIVNSHKLKLRFPKLAISKNYIAIDGLKEINIYDYTLTLIKTIHSDTKPEGLVYSPNGEFLIAGTGAIPLNVNIYSVNQNYKKIQSFKKHKNLTMAVAFLDNQTAISGGGNNSEIYIWDIKTAQVLKKIEGVGDRVWSVGLKGDRVAWGNIDDCSGKNCSKLQKSINLKNFQISGQGLKSSFHRISTIYRNYQLIHRKGGDYGKSDAVLDIKRDGKTIASITRGSTNGYGHKCYGFYKNYIVSGGVNGFIKIYNLEGKEVANLVGHTGEVWSIALDGDRLVSGSDDQTIQIWDLSKLKVKSEKLKINEVSLAGTMKINNLSREKVLKIAKTNNYLYNVIYISPKMQPQLSLFISKTNEWIAWTPQGFYNASKGGEKYIGYHINHGAEHEAEFLDISRFRKQFYRPDLIAKAIEGEDISHYAQGIDIDSILRDSGGLPPKVKILTTPFATDRENIEIGVEVCDMGGGFDNLNFYMDGKAIKYLDQSKAFRRQKKQVQNCTILEEKLSIASGRHTIGVDATNKEGNILSNRATVEITNTQQVITKPNLHLLTLSINDYRDSSLHLKYPNNDAKELTAKVKEIGKPIFKNIYTYALKDSEVTKESISAKIAQIAPKVGVNDVFVLYISGHGITNDKDGDYYFIPYGCPNGADVTQKAISQEQFKKWIAQLQTSKFTILIDTCESGSVAQQSFASSVQRFGTNAGVAIIAGATSKQNAIDGYKKHGIFTYTILEAMSNKKVYSFDDKLSINEVAEYTKYLLPKLAKENFGHEQKPTIYMQGDTSFAIGGI